MALLADPSLAGSDHEGIFTDLDVVLLASQGKNWTENTRKMALREANQVMGLLFRTREACRFGPVDLSQLGIAEADYARVASRIACSNPVTGPAEIKTPNGTFARLMMEDDPITRQGRRLGTNRDDFRSWSSQSISTVKASSRPTKTASDREIVRLQTDLDHANRKISELQTEVARLRNARVKEVFDQIIVPAVEQHKDQHLAEAS